MADVLQVNLGERSYPIYFGEDLSDQIHAHAQALAAAGRRFAVIADGSVAALHGPLLARLFGDAPVLGIAPGEGSKTLGNLEHVLDFLAASRLDREGTLYAVGGGVIGDLSGFAAAVYLRGIDYVQVPTTLLAMVDSSVGGKTGVNLKAGKNLAGAFHQPRAVFASAGFLLTLPPSEFAAGLAEVIKSALLGDRSLFEGIEAAPLSAGDPRLPAVIRRCCAIKAGLVEADERELSDSGGRSLLNLGHTFGHAIERAAGYGTYLHGEAVAIGLCAAARLSSRIGALDTHEAARVVSVVAAHHLPTRLAAPIPAKSLTAAMARDKKARAGSLRFVILTELGAAQLRSGVPEEAALEAWTSVGAA